MINDSQYEMCNRKNSCIPSTLWVSKSIAQQKCILRILATTSRNPSGKVLANTRPEDVYSSVHVHV